MKKILVLLPVFMICFMLSNTFGQSSDPLAGGAHEFELTPDRKQPIRHQQIGDFSNRWYGAPPDGNKIGSHRRIDYSYKTEEVWVTDTWRTIFRIKVDIPATATSLSDIVFITSTNSTLINMKFKIGILNEWNPGEAYSLIGQMPVLVEGVCYGNRIVMCDQIGNILLQNKQAYIYIGVMSENETNNISPTSSENNGSASDLSFTIKGTYHIPNTIVKLTAQNYPPGGDIMVGVDGAMSRTASPYVNNSFVEHSVANLAAVDQMINNEYKGWDNTCIWGKIANGVPSGSSNNRQIDYTATRLETDVTFTANLSNAHCVNIQYSNPGKGCVTVTKEGVTTTVPNNGEDVIVASQNSITLEAHNQTFDNIDYLFESWSDGVTENPRRYTPAVNSSITAIFKGYANISMINLQGNETQVGAKPTITWTDNPNTNVSYRVHYTRSSSTSNTSGETGMILQGTQTFSFGQNIVPYTPNTADLIFDLYAINNLENTAKLAGTKTFNVEGDQVCNCGPGGAEKKNAGIQKDVAITKYAVANYPNPFNPSTVINYQVPEAGHITLKVYDIMGKEIATLIDGVKTKGSYNVNFSMDQYHLASGIYFCRLQAGKNVVTSKMILSK